MESNYYDALEQMREEQKNEELMNKMAEDMMKDELKAEQIQAQMAEDMMKDELKAEQIQAQMAKEEAAASSICITSTEETSLDVTGWNDENGLNVECGDESALQFTDWNDEDGLNIEYDDGNICMKDEQ